MTRTLDFGLDTFGDVTRRADGEPQSQAQTIRDVVDEAVFADTVGVGVYCGPTTR
jgi:hypothetical protein